MVSSRCVVFFMSSNIDGNRHDVKPTRQTLQSDEWSEPPTEPRFAEIRIDELEAENQRLCEALERALHRLTHVDGKVLLAIHDAQMILREAQGG